MHRLLYIGTLPEPVKIIGEHVHAYWEIVYYTFGNGVIKVGDEDISFEPHKIICLPPYIPHSEVSKSGYMNIFFSVDFLQLPSSSIPQFYDNNDKDFFNILHMINREFHRKQGNWQKITESLLETLYQYMLSWTSLEKGNRYVDKFKNILISNISNKNFRVETGIKEIPLAKDYFRYIFKKETGMSPIEYLMEKRIDNAKKLLEGWKTGKVRIKDIANLVGFEDPYYFSRVFKKVSGKSPTEWISGV